MPNAGEQQSPPLKLAGTDAEDIAILSAILQDAVVLASEIRHDAEAQAFSFIAQRYRWEDGRADQGATRTNCRVTALGVTGVAASQSVQRPEGVKLADDASALLALRLPDGDSTLELDFAGETRLRLALRPGWQLRLEDFGQPWPCKCPQSHTI